jgi:hypothetical protein
MNMWEFDLPVERRGKGEGVRGFGMVPHGRTTTNLRFNKLLGFDKQTTFYLF